MFAVTIVLITLWNSYIGWNVELARSPKIVVAPDSSSEPVSDVKKNNAMKDEADGRNESRHALIRNWVDSQFISIPLLGIKVSSDDAAVLGSVMLFFLNWYYCLCLRREHRDVATFLAESRSLPVELRRHIRWSVDAGNVFNIGSDDRPFESSGKAQDKPVGAFFPPMRLLLPIFVYAPFVAILLVMFFDVYCLFGPYESPFRPPLEPGQGLWSALSMRHRWQLILTDSFGVLVAILTLKVCWQIVIYHRQTRTVIDAFEETTQSP
jgi:hypothetical protein